jgi:hypothetical protein
MNVDREIVEHRIKLLFREQYDDLVAEIADEVRGGRAKAMKLVRERARALESSGARFDSNAVRSILAHFPNRGKPKKRGYCYFDARIWLFPRTERVEPNARTIWDCRPKLVFRDMNDPGDKAIVGAVETDGCVIDNHLFNGGVYVAAAVREDGAGNLTEIGKSLRGKFWSDAEFLNYIAAVLNSPQVQAWGESNPLERVRIPTKIEAQIARRMAKLEESKSRPWARSTEPEKTRQRHDTKIGDLFEHLLDALEAAA